MRSRYTRLLFFLAALCALVFPRAALSAEATWTFTDPSIYIYDNAEIELTGGEAQLLGHTEQSLQDDEADFDSGTYTDTDWITDHVQLIPDGGPYPLSGMYTSEVIDSDITKANWTNISWTGEEVNYGAELPDNEGSDNGADMTDNALLLHLDELSGNAIDSSGNGNDCTNYGATYGVAGQFDTAFDFSTGDQDHLRCGAAASLDIGDEVTTEAWVKPIASTYGYILTKNHYTRYAVFIDGDSQFRTYIGGSSYSTNFVFPTDRFTHVASVYDRVLGQLKHFINGQLSSTFSVSTVIDDDGLELDIARRCNAVGDCATGQYYFDGVIDELAFYTRALGDAEISDHYKRGVLNVRTQVCTNDTGAACADFVGPDGTNATYFTNASGNALNVSDDRYFQYRFELTSTDNALTPQFESVTTDYNYYSDDLPDIQPIAENNLPFGRLLTFQETATKNGGEIYYQVSNDAGDSWLYWDGAAWSLAGAGDYNTAAEVNTNIQDLSTGEFLFSALFESNGSQLVELDEVIASSSPRPTGTFNDAEQKADDRALSFSSDIELVPNTGEVYVSIDVYDPDGNLCQASIEYSTDGTNYQKATIDSSTTCTYTDLLGCPGVDNDAAYQIGSVTDKAIATAAGSNTIGLLWNVKQNIQNYYGPATLRLTIYNPISLESIPIVREVTVDTLAPQGLGSIQAISNFDNAVQWGWGVVAQEQNFARYEIWYGTNSSDVEAESGNAMLWSNENDSALSNMDTASTKITELNPDTLYFAKVVAVDHYSNSTASNWNADVTAAASSSCSATIVPTNGNGTMALVLCLILIISLVIARLIASPRHVSIRTFIWIAAFVSITTFAWNSLADEMNYPFDTAANYGYDDSKIEVAAGDASLRLIDGTVVDNDETAFDAGSYTDTDWVTDRLQLIPDSGPYPLSGTYESAIIDAGAMASWNTITWGGEEVNYGEPLLDNQPNNALLYHFEELGGDVADSSGNGNTGTVVGATYGADGRFGKALSFDGNDYVQAADSPSLSITGTALSLEIWAFPDGSSNAALIHKDHHYTLYRRSNGTITYADSITWSYSTIGSYGNAPAGQWNHIVVTFDGSDIRFYINGALVHTRPRSGSLTDNTQPLCVGSYSCTSGFFNGRLDEAAVYDRVLSGPEIEEHYKQGVLRLRAQVRSDDDDTSWGDFVGPDGTNATYFSDPAATAVSVSDNRYFQYKLYLDTENALITPVLNSVEVNQSGYSPDLPVITPAESFNFGRLTTFVETAVKNGGQIRYQLSNDNGASWLYWDGVDWSPAGLNDFNTADDVNTNIQNLPAGDFLFNALLESDGSQHVVLENIAVNSLPMPTGTIDNVAQASNWEDVLHDILPSEAQQMLDDGDVYMSIDVFDPNGLPCRAKVEWSTDDVDYYGATLTGPVECDYFDLERCPGIYNDEEYQLGQSSTKRIATAAGSNTVSFIWESRGDSPDYEGDVILRLTANNWTADQAVPAEFTASIDNLAPRGLADFMIASTTDTSINISWTPANAEANFDRYEIWYGTDLEAVRTRSPEANMIDQSVDPLLSTMSTAGVTIDGLDVDVPYFAKIFALDRFGNIATTSGDGAITGRTDGDAGPSCNLNPNTSTAGVTPIILLFGIALLLVGTARRFSVAAKTLPTL